MVLLVETEISSNQPILISLWKIVDYFKVPTAIYGSKHLPSFRL